MTDTAKTYTVKKISSENIPAQLPADFNAGIWQNAAPLTIENHMGDAPQHKPFTQAKILYDDSAVYVIFRVEDNYIRAAACDFHGAVWEDSCVEFFFTPSDDISGGYFNLETNCGGTLLFCHQLSRGVQTKQIPVDDCKKIRIFTSLPKTIDAVRNN